MIRWLVRLALFGCVALLAGELFFRFVIPAANSPFQVQDRDYALVRFDTTRARDGVFTSGRFAQQRSRWHINNCGYNRTLDYLPPSPGRKPVIVIIGDSFIQGFHVNGDQNVAAVLQERLGNRFDMYTMAEGGSPLTQFMTMARFARDHFDPVAYVFLCGIGDLQKSLYDYYPDGRFMQLCATPDGFEEVPLKLRFHASRLRRLLKNSAIVRYVSFNLNLTLLGGVREAVPPAAKPVPDDIFLKAGAHIARTLRRDLGNADIIFMMNAPLTDIYTGKIPPESPLVRWLTPPGAGCYAFDLIPEFAREFQRDRLRFDYAHEFHWAPHGHAACARFLADFMRQKGILERLAGPPDSTVVAAAAGGMHP